MAKNRNQRRKEALARARREAHLKRMEEVLGDKGEPLPGAVMGELTSRESNMRTPVEKKIASDEMIDITPLPVAKTIKPPDEEKIASTPGIEDLHKTATGQALFNNEIMGAIGRMAAAVEGLAAQVQQGFADINQRVATIEQAQQEGLLTLSNQSGLSVAGLSGQDTGPSQGQLTQTREFSELRRAELALLAEESNDLPAPTDERMVIVGAVTEAEVERRRRMLEEIISRGGMGY